MIHRCIKQGRQFSMWELEASVNLWWVKTKAIYLYIFFHLICLSQTSPKSSSSSTLRLTCIAWRKLPGDLRPIGTASIDQWMETSRIPFQDNGCRTITDRLSCLSILVADICRVFFCWRETPWVDIFSVGRILKCTPVFFLLFISFHFFSISDFFRISCKNHILDGTYFSDVLSPWSSSMFWGSVTVLLNKNGHR